jgi:outer membrane protein OmpA-like peptidoglycan-associated protein
LSRAWRLFLVLFLLVGAFLVAMYFLGRPPAPPSNLIVLLQDPDGTTGSAEVISTGGNQVLSSAGQATGVSSANEKPRPPFALSPADLNGIFGDTTRARPLLPASFTLYFQPNSAFVTAAAQTQIFRIVDEVRRRPIADVSVYGHADNTGDAAIGIRLSLDRAAAVRDALAAQGLDPGNITVSSFGDRDPLVPAAPGAQEPLNRRVEVVVR